MNPMIPSALGKTTLILGALHPPLITPWGESIAYRRGEMAVKLIRITI
jgi:hypothetical protein